MGQTIRIPAPAPGATEKELIAHAYEHLEALQAAMDLDVSHIDSRAEVFEPEIIGAEWTGPGEVTLNFEAQYNIYNGCKDMDIDDSVDGDIVGSVEGGELVFNVFVPPPKRDTVDEF